MLLLLKEYCIVYNERRNIEFQTSFSVITTATINIAYTSLAIVGLWTP